MLKLSCALSFLLQWWCEDMLENPQRMRCQMMVDIVGLELVLGQARHNASVCAMFMYYVPLLKSHQFCLASKPQCIVSCESDCDIFFSVVWESSVPSQTLSPCWWYQICGDAHFCLWRRRFPLELFVVLAWSSPCVGIVRYVYVLISSLHESCLLNGCKGQAICSYLPFFLMICLLLLWMPCWLGNAL